VIVLIQGPSPTIFSRLYLNIHFYKRFYSGSKNLHSHPHANSIRIPLLTLPTSRFFPPLYLHFNKFNYRFYSGTPYIQRHPYANPTIGFLSLRYPP